MRSKTLGLVRSAAAAKLLFLPHALKQMNRPERLISTTEVLQVIENGVVIEDYLDDPRGHSCLILGFGTGGRAIHVVCAPKSDYLAVITAYLPDEVRWSANYRDRR